MYSNIIVGNQYHFLCTVLFIVSVLVSILVIVTMVEFTRKSTRSCTRGKQCTFWKWRTNALFAFCIFFKKKKRSRILSSFDFNSFCPVPRTFNTMINNDHTKLTLTLWIHTFIIKYKITDDDMIQEWESHLCLSWVIRNRFIIREDKNE